MGVSENVVYPIVPNGFADPYPYYINGYFIGKIITQHFQTKTHRFPHSFMVANITNVWAARAATRS